MKTTPSTAEQYLRDQLLKDMRQIIYDILKNDHQQIMQQDNNNSIVH